MTETPTIVQPDVDTSSDIMEIVAPYESNNDPRTRTHIIRPYENGHIWQPGMEAQGVVDLARMNRIMIVALCGHKWLPVHNPEEFEVCDDCLRIAGEIDADPHSHD